MFCALYWTRYQVSVYRTIGPLVYFLCFTRPRYQVSVYRTIGPLVFGILIKTLGSLEKIMVGRETGDTHYYPVHKLCFLFRLGKNSGCYGNFFDSCDYT